MPSGLTMCNIVRDPGEKYCSMYPYLWTISPFQNLVKSHMALIETFPNRKPELPEEAAHASRLIAPVCR
ncbi:MAG: hypothetical protein V3V97_15570 [Hyphomicrobiaceae bacterium]